MPTRRDDSSGYDSDCSRHSDDSNYESLDADQFHRLLRADSFNNHEVEKWMAADKECRTLCCTTAPDPRDSSRAQPAFDDDAAGRHVQFAVDSIKVVVMPTAEEMGPNLSREVYWTRAEFDTMMREPVLRRWRGAPQI